MLFSLRAIEARSQGLAVNCDSGGTIRGALANMKPGDTLAVSGTCNESVTITAEFSRITLDGRGTARIQSPVASQNLIAIQGREITIRGFTLTGGNIGIAVQRGGTAVIDGNTILNNENDGILVSTQAYAAIINNTIENNGWGITVESNSAARIGWQIPAVLGLPNTITRNTDNGILVLHSSSARIIGATITNNGSDGIRVDRASHADISDNNISGNGGNGISVSHNSGVNLDLGRIQAIAQPNRTDAGLSNAGFGIACSSGAYTDGNLWTLTGSKGAMNADNTCLQGLEPLVSRLSFDAATAAPGGTVTAVFSGANLSAQTSFDIRFRTPGSSADQEVLNWQFGAAGTHVIPTSIQRGTYVITAVRAHREIADHSGAYIPISSSLIVQ
jgi:parallel beta-helix repeat protein